MMHYLFQIKAERSERFRAKWLASLMVCFFWMLAASQAFIVAQDEMSTILSRLSWIFPALAFLSVVVQIVFGMRHYYVPTLINLTVSINLSLGITILFVYLSLYSLLPFYLWLTVAALISVGYYLVWHYNQISASIMRLSILRSRRDVKLSAGKLLLSLTSPQAPKWLVKATLYGVVVLVVVLAFGRLNNYPPSIPFMLSAALIFITMFFTYLFASSFTAVLCAITIAKQLHHKDKVKAAKRNAKHRKQPFYKKGRRNRHF